MKLKKYTIDDIYYKKIEEELRENKVVKDDNMFVYFASYYIGIFLHTDLNIKSYIGLKRKDQYKDVFTLMIPFEAIKRNRDTRRFFKAYFERGIKNNERYIGLIKTDTSIGFLLKHDDELLNAYKSGCFSRISEEKKNKMTRLKVIDYDTKVGVFYIVDPKNEEEEWKEYPLGKSDLLLFELYKMIYPEYYYRALSEQFGVNIEYLKKNQVQILPKPNLKKLYLELSEKEEIYWFDKK